jgi:hypothetical protein
VTETPKAQTGSPAIRLWGAARLAGAVLTVAAIVAQLDKTVSVARERDQDMATVLWNFFSFFTILSNVIGAVTLVVGGAWLLLRGARGAVEPRALSLAFLCAGTYMVTTGVVYNLLLRGIELPQGTTVAWSNEVLHVVGPLIFLIDLALRLDRRLAWRDLLYVAPFPIVWAVYTLVRGELVTNPTTGEGWWYPYPFLDPHQIGYGYMGVAAYVVAIAAAILGVAAVAVWWTRRRGSTIAL